MRRILSYFFGLEIFSIFCINLWAMYRIVFVLLCLLYSQLLFSLLFKGNKLFLRLMWHLTPKFFSVLTDLPMFLVCCVIVALWWSCLVVIGDNGGSTRFDSGELDKRRLQTLCFAVRPPLAHQKLGFGCWRLAVLRHTCRVMRRVEPLRSWAVILSFTLLNSSWEVARSSVCKIVFQNSPSVHS